MSFEFDKELNDGDGIGTNVEPVAGIAGEAGAGEDGEFAKGPEALRLSGGGGPAGEGRTLGDIAGVRLGGISGTRQCKSGI